MNIYSCTVYFGITSETYVLLIPYFFPDIIDVDNSIFVLLCLFDGAKNTGFKPILPRPAPPNQRIQSYLLRNDVVSANASDVSQFSRIDPHG